MTDSKTPEWVKEEAAKFVAHLPMHNTLDTTAIIRTLFSQALLSAYERGRADAVEAVPDEIDLYQMLKRAGHRRRADVAKFVSLTIRQLLEVKG